MVELQSVVAETRAAQLAFGAMGESFSLLLKSSSPFCLIRFISFFRLPRDDECIKGRAR